MIFILISAYNSTIRQYSHDRQIPRADFAFDINGGASLRKETEALLHEIESSDDINSFLGDNSQELLYESASAYLNAKLCEKGLTIADVAKRSLHGGYVYKVFNGTKSPSRDILISIGFGMSMSVEEMQMLLRLSGTARLDPRKRRDAVTLYALLREQTITYLNDLLYDMGERTY